MDRIVEIETRLTQIQEEIRGAVTVEALEKLEGEVKTLTEERTQLKLAAEKRSALLGSIASGETRATVIATPKVKEERMTREEALASKEYRSYWAKTLMCRNDYTESEKRAAGVALTTTATTFVEASESTDGVNNGGLFIPTEVNMALMNAIAEVSPVFRDMAKTDIPGLIKFPYKVDATGAEIQTEGVANKDGQIEWADLTLTAYEVSETIRISWKLEKMSVDSFISYITAELVEQCRLAVVEHSIYGTGSNDVTGVTVGAVETTYAAGEELDTIKKLVKSLPRKYRAGAKLYLSESVALDIAFAKDKNGAYLHSPINGTAISSITKYTVEVDPYLKDGDILFGNLGRNYRFNTNEPVSVTKDVSGKARINDYTVYTIIGGAPVPGRIAYATATGTAAVDETAEG